MSNAVENGTFSPVKNSFYYSGLNDENFTFEKLTSLF